MGILVAMIAAAVVVIFVRSGPEAANVAVKCSVYDSDGSVRLTVAGKFTRKESEGACAGLAASYSRSSGDFWKVGAPALPSGEPRLVCAMNAPDGRRARVVVEENPQWSSLTATATELCSRLSGAGWTQAAQAEGPWQREYDLALAREEAIEAEEREEREYVEGVVERCEQKVEAKEEDELRSIERQTKEQVEAIEGEGWEREYEIEDEGWEREEEARERRESAVEECRRVEGVVPDGIVEPPAGTEFR